MLRKLLLKNLVINLLLALLIAPSAFAQASSPPDISGPSTTSGVTGQSFSASFTNVGGSVTTWSISNNPAWLNISASTGDLFGTPPSAGVFSGIIVTATNSFGSDNVTFTITIVDPPTPTPTSTSTPTITPTATVTSTFTATPLGTATPLILRPGTVLTAPPDVQVIDKKVKISFEGFDGASLQSGNSSPAKLKRKSDLSVLYRVPIRRITANSNRDVKRLATKRNSLTVRNLKPGNYTASYRAVIVKGDKELSSTPQSPKVPFAIFKKPTPN